MNFDLPMDTKNRRTKNKVNHTNGCYFFSFFSGFHCAARMGGANGKWITHSIVFFLRFGLKQNRIMYMCFILSCSNQTFFLLFPIFFSIADGITHTHFSFRIWWLDHIFYGNIYYYESIRISTIYDSFSKGIHKARVECFG